MLNAHPHTDHSRGRKQVTVLFADIVRSSDIVRKFDSEVAEEIFSQVIMQQIEITKKFEGTVNQVMGDGIMCLFGAEPPYEEHALRAASAGREMIRAALQVQEKYRHIRLRIRVGINTGDVMLARPRNEGYRATFQVTGEAVHVTDRVLKQAKPNRMAVSPSSKAFLEKYYHFRKAGSLKWNPEMEPMELYEITALKPPVPLRAGAVCRESTPRPALENRINALLSAARKKGEPEIAWLHGAAGVGKTHLVHRIIQKRYKDKLDVSIQLNFFPDPISDTSQPFESVVLESLFGRDRARMLETLSRRTFSAIRKKLPFFEDCIRDICGMGGIDPVYASIEGVARTSMKAKVVASLLLRMAEKKNIALILEDMHLAKEISLVYIGTLVRLYQGHETLAILATSRKENPFGKTAGGSKIKEILVGPMTVQESLSFLRQLDARKKLTPAVKNKISALSGGNPYFISEYFYWAQDRAGRGLTCQEIKKELDRYTPGKVADILYNKLAATGGEFVRVAKIASVLGMRISLDILHSVCGHDRRLLVSLLAHLEETEIIKKDRVFPHPEWVFMHELLQKVIYNSIPQSMRVVWHKAVIGELKKSRFRGVEGRHGIMAFHAAKAGDKLLAHIYSKWAARQESAASRHKSALELSRASRRALAGMPKLKCRERHEIRAFLFEINGLFITGKYGQASKHIEALLKKKGTLKKFGYLEPVLSFRELDLWIKGDLRGAARIARSILSLDITDNRREIHIRENSRLGNMYIDMGLYRESVKHDLKVVMAVPDRDFRNKFHLLVQARPASLSSLALAYAGLGDAKKSREYFDRAYPYIDRSDDYFTKIFILVYLAHSLILQKKNAAALGLLATAREHCKKIGATLLMPYVLSAYGIALVRTGRPEEGLPFCRAALAAAARNKLVVRRSQFEVWHAEALMAQGCRQRFSVRV